MRNVRNVRRVRSAKSDGGSEAETRQFKGPGNVGTDDHWHTVVGSANLLNFSKTCAGNSRASRLPNASSDAHVGKDDRWAIPSSLSRGNEQAEIKFYRKDDGVAAIPSQSSAATGNGECGEGAGTKSVFHHPRSGLKGLATRMWPRTNKSK